MTDRMDKLVEALWHAVYPKPAASHKEIAARMTIILGYPLQTHQVCTVLKHLRGHYLEYGWHVPHGARGKAKGKVKFVAARVLREDEDAPFDEPTEAAVNGGAKSTLLHTVTSLRNLANGLDCSSSYLRSSPAKRQYKSIARKLTNLSGDAEEVAEILLDEDAA